VAAAMEALPRLSPDDAKTAAMRTHQA